MRRIAFTAAATLLFSTTALAGPLNPNYIADDARWIFHVDVEGFLNSDLGKCMLEAHGDDMEGVDEINEALGIDLLHDVLGLTIYADDAADGKMNVKMDDDEVEVSAHADAHERAVAVVVMTQAADAMLERIKQDESYAEVTKGDITLHSFVDHDSEMRHLLYIKPGESPNQRIVVAGPNIDPVIHGVNVVNGKAKNIKNGEPRIPIVMPHPGSLAFATAAELEGLDGDNPASQILDKSSQIMLDFGEHDGNAFTVMAVTAKTEEDANNISQILQGLTALGRMVLANEDEAEELLDLLNAVKFQSSDKHIVAMIKLPSERACEMIKEAAEHHNAFGDDDDDKHDEDDDQHAIHRNRHGD